MPDDEVSEVKCEEEEEEEEEKEKTINKNK
jgi:hypothetical protein